MVATMANGETRSNVAETAEDRLVQQRRTATQPVERYHIDDEDVLQRLFGV